MFYTHVLHLWILFSCINLSNGFSSYSHQYQDDNQGEVDLYKKAQYHIRELTETLHQLRIGTKHTSRQKRDSSYKNTIIMDSLVNICYQLNNDFKTTGKPFTTTDAPKTTTTTKVKNVYMDYNGADSPLYWDPPDLYLKNARVEQNGTTAVFIFKVVHSKQAFVTRTRDFISFSDLIGPAGSYENPITTEVEIEVNKSNKSEYSSYCYVFGLENDRRFTLETEIDPYGFDKLYTHYDLQLGDTWETYNTDDILQILWRPFYRPVSKNAKEGYDFVKPGEQTIFEFDVLEINNQEIRFNFYGVLWDWDNKTFLEYYNYNLDIHGKDDEDDIFFVRFVKCVEINTTDIYTEYDEKQSSGKICRIRLFENFASRRLSGKISLIIYRGSIDPKRKNIIETFTQKYSMYLRLAYKSSPFPPGEVEIYQSDRYSCMPDPYNNCTINCYADGSDIQSISIIKTSPYIPPQQSSFTVINGETALAMIDVGPNSEQIDGQYKCIVITTTGRSKVKPFLFYSTQFTKIVNLTIEEKNEKIEGADEGLKLVVIECEVGGFQPINMTLQIDQYYYDKSLSIDDVAHQVDLETTGGTTRMVAEVDMKYVIKPYMHLLCKAEGERGNAEELIDLSKFPWYN